MSTDDGRKAAAQALVARRSDLEMTQDDLAVKAGVSVRTVGNVETSRVWPSPKTRARLEKAVEWPVGHMEAVARAHDSRKPVIAPDLRRSLERLGPEERDYVIGLLTRRGDGLDPA